MANLPRIYIAGPLFSDAERAFNVRIRSLLSSKFATYLPQEDGGLICEMVASGARPSDAARRIFEIDVDAIRHSDYFLFIMDGRTIDEGAAFELGVAYTLGKRCVGLQTDPRRLLPFGNNPMIEQALTKIFRTVDEFEFWLKQFSHQDDAFSGVQALGS